MIEYFELYHAIPNVLLNLGKFWTREPKVMLYNPLVWPFVDMLASPRSQARSLDHNEISE